MNRLSRFIYILKYASMVAMSLAIYGACVMLNISLPCPLRYFTGFYCGGCGMTRMCLTLLNFNFYQAFRHNPLSFVVVPIGILILLFEAWYYIVNGKVTKNFGKMLLLYGVTIIIFGVLRNIGPFKWLSPTVVR